MPTINGIRVPDHWRWAGVAADVKAGRLWKARDRLQGHLVEEPANQDVLDMLGAVHFAMGDLPEAGRYWWLTERETTGVGRPGGVPRAVQHHGGSHPASAAATGPAGPVP